MRFKPIYFCLALAIFFAEILIASVFSSSAFVRGSLGDLLVVMLLFYLVLAFWPVRPLYLALALFVFACALEAGQYFQLPRLLGVERDSVLGVVVGSTFSWEDILMYFLGCLAALALSRFVFNEH